MEIVFCHNCVYWLSEEGCCDYHSYGMSMLQVTSKDYCSWGEKADYK